MGYIELQGDCAEVIMTDDVMENSSKRQARSRARTKEWMTKKREESQKEMKENGFALKVVRAPPKPREDVNLHWLQAAFYPASTGRKQIGSE